MKKTQNDNKIDNVISFAYNNCEFVSGDNVMKDNPFAETMYNAFMDAFYGPKNEAGKRDNANVKYDERTPEERKKNTIGNILQYARLKELEISLNSFIKHCGKTVKFPENIDEEAVIKFVQFISGYIRDDQVALTKLSSKYTLDPDLRKLYYDAAKYSEACSLKGVINKLVFDPEKEHQMWEINNPHNLKKATYVDEAKIVPGKETLVLSMSFSIQPEVSAMQEWTDKFLHQIVDDQEFFGKDKDASVFLSYTDRALPRGNKFGLIYQTLANPDYFSPKDMDCVKSDFMQLLGEDIKLDRFNRVVKGKPFSKEQLNENMKKLNFFGYCFGASCVHRYINAMHHIASQLYDKETVDAALKKINVVNYGLLPISDKLKYSCISMISNYTDDYLRAEAQAKNFKPELYEQIKCREEDGGFRISSLGEKNHIIAFALDEDTKILDANGNIMDKKLLENGHTIAIVTQKHVGEDVTMSFEAVKFLLKEISKHNDNADLIMKKLKLKLESYKDGPKKTSEHKVLKVKNVSREV